jgi:hypothetical protein
MRDKKVPLHPMADMHDDANDDGDHCLPVEMASRLCHLSWWRLTKSSEVRAVAVLVDYYHLNLQQLQLCFDDVATLLLNAFQSVDYYCLFPDQSAWSMTVRS